jgi:hypothetical protein
MRPRLHEVANAGAAAEQVRDQAAGVLHAALRAHAVLDAARRAISHERDAASQLSRLDQQQKALEIERDALAVTAPPSGWFARRRHARDLADATDDVRRFVADNVDRRGSLQALQRDARALAGNVTSDDLAEIDRRVGEARAAVQAAEKRCTQIARTHDDLQGEFESARAVGAPSAAERDLVANATQRGLPAAHFRLRTLQRQQNQGASERGALEEKHRHLIDRSRRLRADAEAQLVREARVVATTLARSRVHRAVAAETFDVVLVDEAGAATLAEVVLALRRARTTAVLFGDFLQLGPVLDGPVKTDADSGVMRWVRGTCFSHAGIRVPEEALSHPSCIALLHQFRFGPELRRLANDVVYRLLRDADELPDIRAEARTDIVVVDVSTVPGLAEVCRPAGGSRWWLAGVVLGRALVELHLPEGRVGLVTPYRPQVEAVLQALEDRRVVAGAAVGTVHSFQGREFPTVVFDLVDDGEGWIARARADRGTWEADGLKLFGVGITRARDRLYVLVDGRAVRQAGSGPLLHLRRGLERGEIRCWSAAALLGQDDPPAGIVDDTFADVARLLQQLVTVTDVHDEHSFGSELERRLAAARRSVWMWSPWIANHGRIVVPLIVAAVRRGVDVRVFIRPDTDRNMASTWAQRQLSGLRDSGATVIRSDHEHRKIVVVDQEVVLLGSLNVLSNSPGKTRETMITMEGRAFTARLLTELRAEEIGTVQVCDRCGNAMEVRRREGRTPDLFWHCRPCNQRIPLQRTGSPRASGTGGRPART